MQGGKMKKLQQFYLLFIIAMLFPQVSKAANNQAESNVNSKKVDNPVTVVTESILEEDVLVPIGKIKEPKVLPKVTPKKKKVVTPKKEEQKQSCKEDCKVRTLHFIQDDAQDYMVSKIYKLKYVQANDVAPFLTGIVMRYNINSSVGSIQYGNNGQMLTVTCPVKMMPYVDDFIAKVDRNIPLSNREAGEIIKGTGITRAVYHPKYRSGEEIVQVLINSVIGAGPHSSIYAWDKNTNQIYWKDNSSNTSYVYEFLNYLDRPIPRISLDFNLYEVRDSVLSDVGLDYLAWKNGPGLNLFQASFDSFSVNSAGSAAIQSSSGPVGGFFFAPQFDASFIRLLQQSGQAKIRNTATLTVSNSDSKVFSLSFNPSFQNIIKSNNDQTSVNVSNLALSNDAKQLYLEIRQPIVNVHYGSGQKDYPDSEVFDLPNYKLGDYGKLKGNLYCSFYLTTANVVERDNFGNELVEQTKIDTYLSIPLLKDKVIASWEKFDEVEQRIGVPYLMDLPILKYLFSTTTKNRQKTKVYLVVNAKLLDGSKPCKINQGELFNLKLGSKK
jgi:hypothetical protein